MTIEQKNQKYIERRILKNRKKKNSRYVWLFFFLIIGGYVFFFISPDVFHMKSESLYTEQGESLKYADNVNVSIKEWNYSNKQNLMEVVFSIQNTSIYIKNTDIKYYAFCNRLERNQKRVECSVEVKLNEYNLVSLWIGDVPKDFNTCTLILTSDVSTPDESEYLELYNNREKVKKVKSITEKSLLEYKVDDYNSIIKGYKDEIKKNDEAIETLNKEIAQLKTQNTELKNSEVYVTANEIEEIENTIKSNQEQITSKNNQIASYQVKNSEIEADIAVYQELIDKINGNTTAPVSEVEEKTAATTESNS